MAALAALNTTPDRCLALEDSAPGVKAASSLGIEVWGLDIGGYERPEARDQLLGVGAAKFIDDVAVLQGLLAELFG